MCPLLLPFSPFCHVILVQYFLSVPICKCTYYCATLLTIIFVQPDTYVYVHCTEPSISVCNVWHFCPSRIVMLQWMLNPLPRPFLPPPLLPSIFAVRKQCFLSLYMSCHDFLGRLELPHGLHILMSGAFPPTSSHPFSLHKSGEKVF
jgi:hypothetical protein